MGQKTARRRRRKGLSFVASTTARWLLESTGRFYFIYVPPVRIAREWKLPPHPPSRPGRPAREAPSLLYWVTPQSQMRLSLYIPPKKGLMAVSHKPLKCMVVVRLNNYLINLLKLLHKINFKFLDTNKSTNNFFWYPTGWGNAKIMGANKNLLNFSELITPTSLLQSSRCFRQKNFLFFYS